MISADKPRLSSTVCLALRLAAGADCFQRAVILSVLTLLCHWGLLVRVKEGAVQQIFFFFFLILQWQILTICRFLFQKVSFWNRQNMVNKGSTLVVCIYYTIQKSIELQFEEKQIITWLPCKLLHVPQTNNEQENVVGESFLDIYRIK